MSPLRILMITAEFAPFAKVGGLGDMTAGLAGYLAGQGHEVMVVLPDYGNAQSAAPWSVRGESVEGLQVFRVAAAEHFADADIYLGDDRDAARFVLLAEAALAHAHATGFVPHVIHVHDWHAAAAVVLPKPWPAKPATLLTIHNIGYQGIFAPDVLAATPFAGHAPLLADPTTSEPRLNLLAAGIAGARAVTTVSPTHAREILTPEYGVGLDALLRDRAAALHGILNGADYRLWSPERDALLSAPFSAAQPQGKRTNREALLAQIELPLADDCPLLCMVTRLTEHKGMDLLLAALPALLGAHEFALVVLGQGDAHYSEALASLAAAHPKRMHLSLAHDEGLAHRLLAGSDMLLMPSRYEPCGLTQLYAMRYGTVPIVRATGGLADSVRHFDAERGEGTGVVFRDYDVQGLQWGVGQALDWFADAGAWRRLMANAMAEDFSWQRQGPHYERLYRQIARS
ncbi:MAG: glycogen synthase [Gammaproteobacteria bacterium]|nr:glycogen synthase [Gammaproteobacteria bacterium]